MTDYQDLDATDIASLIRNGDVSACEILNAAIARAEAVNADINAIVTPMYEQAEGTAKDATGPLGGVPFLIKDLAMVEGVRCSMGSRLWQDFVPDHDAEIVRRYRDAGLVIMGKSNTPEVGLAATTESTFLGACKNPFDLTRTPGGSSGGAAAAVAAGIVPVAHATDGGGSIRIPASCCGLVGLKPTRARTPSGPDVGEGWGSMATGHVVSRTVRDTAAFLDATHGPAAGDPYHALPFTDSYVSSMAKEPGSLRIGIDMLPASGIPNALAAVHPECHNAIAATVSALRDIGHSADEIDISFDREQLSMATSVLVMSNVANTVLNRADALGLATDELGDYIETNTMHGLEMGLAATGRDYAKATMVIHQAGRTIESCFADVDLIMSPTLLQPPVELGYMKTDSGEPELYGAAITSFWGYTHLYNATGHPAISLPLYRTPEGLPVGVQFVAPMGGEVLLLQLARQLEEAMPWRDSYRAVAV